MQVIAIIGGVSPGAAMEISTEPAAKIATKAPKMAQLQATANVFSHQPIRRKTSPSA